MASSEAKLREASDKKDEFLATLAHELRKPLAPIRSAVHIVNAKSGDIKELRWASGAAAQHGCSVHSQQVARDTPTSSHTVEMPILATAPID